MNNISLNKKSVIIVSSQLFGMGISFLMVPILLSLLGIKNYGIWVTLIGIVEWLNFFDVGFGHGLRNKYAEAKAKRNENEIVKYVSTTFFSLLGISLAILLLFLIVGRHISWTTVLNAPPSLEDNLYKLSLVLCTAFSLRFVLSIVYTLLTADHKPHIQSILVLLGSILSLLSLLILKKLNINSFLIIGVAITISQTSPLLFAFAYLFSTKYAALFPKFSFFSKKTFKEIFSLGINFFSIQISALLLFQTNNIIILHISGAELVTEYNVSYKYMNIIYMLFLAFLTPYWSFFTTAYAQNDLEVISKNIRKINIIWCFALIVGIIQIILAPIVFKLWVKNTLTPNYYLLSLLLIYFILTMRYTVFRTVMNGVSKIKLQFYITFIEGALHIPIALVMGKIFGMYGVLGTMILWSIINNIWEPIQYNKIIRRKDYGIWSK